MTGGIAATGGTVDDDPSLLDGRNVWNTVSRGDPSPRTEILLNIDPHPTGELGFSFYEGIGLRYGDMKLLLGVNNGTWFKPPEEGGQPITARDRIPENDVTEEAKPSQVCMRFFFGVGVGEALGKWLGRSLAKEYRGLTFKK